MNKSDNEKFRLAYKILNENDNSLSNDRKKYAFNIWQELAQKYIRSSFYLGVCYDDGFGTKRNVKKAFEWYRVAAVEGGHPESMYNLFIMYRDGVGVGKNNKMALKWLKDAVKQRDISAIRDLGYCYHEGNLLPKDYAKAAKLYNEAAQQGDTKSQWNLALCYLNGEGVKKSDRWGKYWLEKAAKNGHSASIKKLKEQKKKKGNN